MAHLSADTLSVLVASKQDARPAARSAAQLRSLLAVAVAALDAMRRLSHF